MTAIEYVHEFVGIPYWETIILVTLGLRTLLLPLTIKSLINGAKMAAIRPQIQSLQEEMTNHPQKDDPAVRNRFQAAMKELFTKNQVNPFRAMVLPFVQIPVFFTFYFAMQDMGKYFPDFATGGTAWFTNLAMADPTYAFPLLNSLSFLMMIELGSYC